MIYQKKSKIIFKSRERARIAKNGFVSANTSLFCKSKSVNKFNFNVDKEEIYKEFIDYKKKNLNMIKRGERSASGNKKSKFLSASNLVKVRTVKIKNEVKDSGKKMVNMSQSDFNKSRDKIMSSVNGIESYKSNE
jgi:hypothetical protein